MADSNIEENGRYYSTNTCPCNQDTPRASTFLRKYLVDDIPIELLDELKKAERGTQMRYGEFDITRVLHDKAEGHQDECEAALLAAMALAQSNAKALEDEVRKAVEDWKRLKMSKGGDAEPEVTHFDKQLRRARAASILLGHKIMGSELQDKALADVSSGKGEGSTGKWLHEWIRGKDANWVPGVVVIIMGFILYRAFF